MAILLTEDLRDTDKMCESWARERRDAKPSLKCTLHNMALVKQGVVLEGSLTMSDDSLLIDRIFLTSPPKVQAILTLWYCDSSPVPVKAKKCGLGRTALYAAWKEVLSYVRGRLHELALSA